MMMRIVGILTPDNLDPIDARIAWFTIIISHIVGAQHLNAAVVADGRRVLFMMIVSSHRDRIM